MNSNRHIRCKACRTCNGWYDIVPSSRTCGTAKSEGTEPNDRVDEEDQAGYHNKDEEDMNWLGKIMDSKSERQVLSGLVYHACHCFSNDVTYRL